MHAGAVQDQQQVGQQTAAAAAVAPPDAGVSAGDEGGKRKRAKLKHASADGHHRSDSAGGISLFGGQPSLEKGQHDGEATAAFADTAPRVQTGDPYEEANLLRKAHRIKARGVAARWLA
jgi:hypothetical protein